MRAPLRAPLTVRRLSLLALAATLGLAPALGACSTYQDDLARSQRAFEHADYERALAIFRSLELDVPSHFSVQEQAQYCYLRGMTDYRVGYKVDARHWLALAHALDSGRKGVLPKDWRARLKDTLGELNEQVYTSGIESLAESEQEPASTPKAKPAAVDKPKSEDDP
jgi:hypothetical protein